MLNKAYIGIDTSCYTTSVCFTNEEKKIIAERQIILSVKQGERGLRQQDANFQHIRNLTTIFKEIGDDVKDYQLAQVNVSTVPRRVEGSYMPVFLSGLSVASALATTHGVPLLELSHQEGHVLSVFNECGSEVPNECLALHLSGGTTELLVCKKDGERFTMECIGKTLDISFGQFVDRTGVLLGLPFPSGKHVSTLAQKSSEATCYKVTHKGLDLNISGAESQAIKDAQTLEADVIAKKVINTLVKHVSKWVENAIENTAIRTIVASGGVMANGPLREALTQLGKRKGFEVLLASPKHSTDSAYGISCYRGRDEVTND